MKPVPIVACAFAFSVVGTWSKNEKIAVSQIVGGSFLVLVVAIMQGSQPKLAQQFSWLLLAATVGAYGEDVFDGIGTIVGKGEEKRTGGGAGGRRTQVI